MCPLALPLIPLLPLPPPQLGLLDQSDPFLQRRESKEPSDLGGRIEGSGLSEEESGVESGLETFGFARGLDDLEEVLVRFHLLTSEESFEGEVVRRGAVASVRDEDGLAEVPAEPVSSTPRSERERSTHCSSS